VSPVDLHHVIDGPDEAPAVVLGPSLGTSTEVWERSVGALAERFRVIRYDPRGQGESPVPPGPYEIADLGRDVVALLDRLGIERASVGGVSLGGMVALWLGANAPDRVQSVLALCTSAYVPDAPWAERAAAVREAGSTEPIADGVVQNWLTPGYAREHPETREWLRGLLVASPPEGYAECCGAIERMDLREDLDRIEAPTLVVSATDDPSTPPEHQQLIAGLVSNARLEVVANAAHLAIVEHPETLDALIVEHLDEAGCE
jgi:3-oxoadipate enol-lactonase